MQHSCVVLRAFTLMISEFFPFPTASFAIGITACFWGDVDIKFRDLKRQAAFGATYTCGEKVGVLVMNRLGQPKLRSFAHRAQPVMT